MTTKTKILFFFIMGLAGFVIAVVLLLENLGGLTLRSRGGVSAEITVAVPPALLEWAQASASDFNGQNSQITVQIVEQKGLDAGRDPELSGGVYDAWIAEADFVRQMAGNIPYQEAGTPVAQSSLVWVAPSARSGLIDNLSWQNVHAAATDAAQWQILGGGDARFDAALPSPSNSVGGLAAYLSAAAAYNNRPDLNAGMVFDPQFLSWMGDIENVVPEKRRAPIDQLSRPPVSVDVGLLLSNDLSRLNADQFIQQPPVYNIALNFPYLMRQGIDSNDIEDAADREQASILFRDFLLSAESQNRLSDYGFEPANAPVPGQQIQVDGQTANRLRSQFQ